jgi:hypothetical protein
VDGFTQVDAGTVQADVLSAESVETTDLIVNGGVRSILGIEGAYSGFQTVLADGSGSGSFNGVVPSDSFLVGHLTLTPKDGNVINTLGRQFTNNSGVGSEPGHTTFFAKPGQDLTQMEAFPLQKVPLSELPNNSEVFAFSLAGNETTTLPSGKLHHTYIITEQFSSNKIIRVETPSRSVSNFEFAGDDFSIARATIPGGSTITSDSFVAGLFYGIRENV